MFTKIKRISKEFPNAFKVLTLATFIDRLGGFLLFPFLTHLQIHTIKSRSDFIEKTRFVTRPEGQ